MKTVRMGFSLVEMLVVIGIIAVLIGASIGGYSAMTKTAEKAKGQEVVSNVATALAAMFQQEGVWPKKLASQGKSDGRLTADVCLALARGRYYSLSTDTSDPTKATKLIGVDRFGILSPWGTAIVKRKGNGASEGDICDGSTKDYYLHYALDLDGDGIIEGVNVGGKTFDLRATVAVWCGGKDGFIDPYPYAGGGNNASKGKGESSSSGKRSDDIYSWTPGQTKDVK